MIGARPGDAFARSPNMLDGGDDAPLSPRGRMVFRVVLATIVVVGILLIVLTRLG
jgi:hypothetical protein